MFRPVIHLSLLEKHLRYIHSSGFLKNDYPLSTLIIAHPERGKTTELIKIMSQGSMVFNDLTTYGLLQEIANMNEEDRNGLHHVVIPDLERINARSDTIRHEICANLQILMQEGLQKVRTKFLDIDIPNKRVGVIMATTPSDIGDKRGIFRRTSFMSRLIPYSYEYSADLVKLVLDFIMSNKNVSKAINENVTKKMREVSMDIGYKEKVKEHAINMNRAIEDFTAVKHPATIRDYSASPSGNIYKRITVQEDDQLIGARALDHLIVYVKSIALYNGHNHVSNRDFSLFEEQTPLFNFDRNEIIAVEKHP